MPGADTGVYRGEKRILKGTKTVYSRPRVRKGCGKMK